jgi:hypothetical protein
LEQCAWTLMVMQFNLKTVLLGMTGIAVVCSVIAPFVRHLTLQSLSVISAGALAGAGFTVVVDLVMQRRTRRRLGKRRILLRRTEDWFRYSARRFVWLALASIVAVGFFAINVRIEASGHHLMTATFSGFLAAVVSGQVIDCWRTFHAVEFYDDGLVLNRRRYSWSDPPTIQWDEETGALVVWTEVFAIRIAVPLGQRSAVSAILGDKCEGGLQKPLYLRAEELQ